MTKFGGAKMEIPSNEDTKFKISNCLSYTHEIFRIGKYEGKIKFDKNFGYHNGGFSLNGATKLKNFCPLKLDK